MSGDVTVSVPEGRGREVSPGNHEPGLRLRSSRASEIPRVVSATRILSPARTGGSVQARHRRKMNLNIENIELGDKERVVFLNHFVNLLEIMLLHRDLGRIFSTVIIWILLLQSMGLIV